MSLEPNNLTYDILVARYAKKNNKVEALRLYCDGKIPIFNLELSRLSDFQPETSKPDILHPRTNETVQITP